MAIVIKEADDELGAEEKLIALKILLVIYLHDKRHLDALADIEKLLNDPKMREHREYLISRREEVRQALANLSNKRRPGFLQFIFDFFHNAVIVNPGVPTWWPGWCLSYDVVAAAYLAALILIRRTSRAA